MESREADDVRGLVNIHITPGSGKPLCLSLCLPLDHYLCWSIVSQPGTSSLCRTSRLSGLRTCWKRSSILGPSAEALSAELVMLGCPDPPP